MRPVTITPVALFRLGVAVARAWQERKARRRLTHRDDIKAVPAGARTVEPMDLPERPTENE